MSLYARAARSAWPAVGANFGGSSTIEIEAPRPGRAARAALEHVGFEPLGAAGVEAVQRERSRARAASAARRAVDREHRARAARQRGEREAAGVAEAVEHVAAGGERADAAAVVALVEIEAGLLAVRDVDAVAAGRARRYDGRDRQASPRSGHRCAAPALRARARRDPSARSAMRSRSSASRASTIASRQRSAPADENWQHGDVAVAVDDHARQAVGLAVHQPHRVRRAGDRPARRAIAARDARAKNAASIRSASSKLQTRARICDCGLYAAQARKRAGARADRDRVAAPGAAVDALDRAREHPRMAAERATSRARASGPAPARLHRAAHAARTHARVPLSCFFVGARGCAAS